MKIHDPSHLAALDRRHSETSSKKNASGFQQVFDAMFDQATKGHPAPSAVIHSSSLPPLTVNAMEPRHPTSDVQAMERFLDSLEDYQKGLADPQCNLRDLQPALERLEREQRHLSHWADITPEDNPLKHIIDEGLVTATLETGRFRSGVYC